MIFKQSSILSVVLLAGCATTITPENYKPRKPSISAEKSPINGAVGYSLHKSDKQTIWSTTKGNWKMGDYFGTWSTKGSSSDLIIRTVSSSKTSFTINGGVFSQPLAANCEGKSHKSNWAFYKLKPNDLTYVCEFDDKVTKFEIALDGQGTALGALLNTRFGWVQHDGTELRLEEALIDGPKYPRSTNNGYILDAATGEVAGLDYRERDSYSSVSTSPDDFMIFLPPKGDPNHKAAVVGTIALAFYDDPKRRLKCDSENHSDEC